MKNVSQEGLSPNSIRLALQLRIASLMAFPAAAALAAILQRGFLVLLLLATGMMFVSWVERIRFLRAAGETRRCSAAPLVRFSRNAARTYSPAKTSVKRAFPPTT